MDLQAFGMFWACAAVTMLALAIVSLCFNAPEVAKAAFVFLVLFCMLTVGIGMWALLSIVTGTYGGVT